LADWLVKGNQGSLRKDVELFATEQKAKDFADTRITRDTTVDGDHGRTETRTTTVINDVDWLQERHDWPGLKAVVMVESSREANGKIEHETRFYLTLLVMVAALLGPIVRSHWSIENSLHWVMDMMFRDDECRVEPTTRQRISPRSSTWPITFCEPPGARIRCVCATKSPLGTTTSSQASSLGENLHPIPLAQRH